VVAVCVSWSDGWIDGTAIVIAILLVAFVTATNNYRKELQFRALRNDADAMIRIRAIRNGVEVLLAIHEIVVGDVMHLETGDKVLADAIFINGSSVKTDESAITGEADNVSKDTERDPFLLSGTSLASGSCNALVTSVGIRSVQVCVTCVSLQRTVSGWGSGCARRPHARTSIPCFLPATRPTRVRALLCLCPTSRWLCRARSRPTPRWRRRTRPYRRSWRPWPSTLAISVSFSPF
jgi:hypothetical protein